MACSLSTEVGRNLNLCWGPQKGKYFHLELPQSISALWHTHNAECVYVLLTMSDVSVSLGQHQETLQTETVCGGRSGIMMDGHILTV